MLKMFRRELPPAAEPLAAAPAVDAVGALRLVSERAAGLGRESAEVCGVIADTHRVASAQAATLQALSRQLQDVVAAQAAIAGETENGLRAVAEVGDAVQAVGNEVGGIVDTLRQVSGAADQITQIALQTRLVAFNASVEAKRAGEAGRGFGVVADAVKELATKVETSSKEILATVGRLDERIAALAREIRRSEGGAEVGAVHRALDAVVDGVGRIHDASRRSREVCAVLETQMSGIEGEVRQTTRALDAALGRTENFLRISEQLIEAFAVSGLETEDSPYIRAAQQAAAQVAALLEDALAAGRTTLADLFDERYQPLAGTEPAQHTARFSPLAEKLFPQVQEAALSLSDKVVFCIAVDRNGYVACHNRRYNQPQRAGDLLWNTANSRWRRIFNDRTGLASARNQRPFLLQTYRRDMGGGRFVVLKEAAAPIVVGGRHWGGLRLAFNF
ncbi:chemotaxis protein [Rubrivivax gelatinosus]|uniref:Chemotaxis protein n=1 Tax=Rubrivivax gelatinosus TaxID=28068 RepID=A0ABS1DU20_RUBGE|nr:methyl-accepting chemotaxis protein [Rubrivivax gelatinosus]MBK1616589.1 chemotaxis protein [Rubrivivax gelatinosus]MBK1712968.1 chemotaxis protein [Rubrivivax gelatinosus]